MDPAKPERRDDLDWLRIFAVLLLIPFHTAMIFVIWNWHIKNDSLSLGLTLFNSFLGIWHMPLFFILSGAGTYFALSFRSSRAFIKERALRLLVPLVFGILAIVPPQVYLERLHRLQFSGSFTEFYPSILLTGPYPDGNLSWHHLWFLAYLLVFSLMYLPLFRRLGSDGARHYIEGFASFFGAGRRIFLLSIPLVIFQMALRVRWPNGNQNLVDDWANFFFYSTIYILGYIIHSERKLGEAVAENRRLALTLAGLGAAGHLALLVTGNSPRWGYNAENIVFLGFNGFITWCWLLALMGFGRAYLNRPSALLRYFSGAAYPFYILHQTVIVLIGYYIVQYRWTLEAKFIAINALAFILTMVIYDLLVKRIQLLSFLFGMKT